MHLARHAACALAFTFACGVTTHARADLAPAFAQLLSVDTGYVANAPEATDIAFSGDGRTIVTLKTGPVLIRQTNGTVVTVPYPFGGTLDNTDEEKGLLGVVADPNVAQNQTFYFYVSNGPTADKHRVYRAVLTPSNTLNVDVNPVVGLARGVGPGLEGPANHDGGGMIVYQNQLYVGVGDTGANASPPVNKYASCLNKGNGKILRVNLDGSVPGNNPLVGLSSVTACSTPTGPWSTAAPDARVYAWGLRNPWRFWVDPHTGLLWIGDVGEATQEEISVGTGNQHYGYPFVEGNMAWGDVDGLNCVTTSPSRPCTPPAFSYTHDVGQAITGGLVPEGCGWSTVFATPSYVYGDSSAGFIRALPLSAARTGFSSTTPVDVASYAGIPVSFRMGPDGALYVVFYGFGAVYRFAPSLRAGADCPARVPSDNGWSLALLGVLLGVSGAGFARMAARAGADGLK
jgi:glucose/arabinose dehydrogenase